MFKVTCFKVPFRRRSFNQVRNRLIRFGLSGEDAVKLILRRTCEECQWAERSKGLADLLMCDNPASRHYLHIFETGHETCRCFQAKLAKSA